MRASKTLLVIRPGGWDGHMARRHWRAYPDVPEVTGPPRAKKKNRRDFCLGKPGRDHTFEVQVIRVWRQQEEMVDTCTGCGKQKLPFSVWTAPKPEWARRLNW